LSRLYLGRFSDVHIGGPSSNQATSLESQMIHPTQLLPGRTLSFSVYIFHFFILDIIMTVLLSFNFEQIWLSTLLLLPIFFVTVVLTSGIAFISKRIIEDPAITYGHKLSQSIAVAGLRVEKSRDPGLAVWSATTQRSRWRGAGRGWDLRQRLTAPPEP